MLALREGSKPLRCGHRTIRMFHVFKKVEALRGLPTTTEDFDVILHVLSGSRDCCNRTLPDTTILGGKECIVLYILWIECVVEPEFGPSNLSAIRR